MKSEQVVNRLNSQRTKFSKAVAKHIELPNDGISDRAGHFGLYALDANGNPPTLLK